MTNDKRKGCGRKRLWLMLTYYLSRYLEILSKITKIVCNIQLSLGQISKKGSFLCETGLVKLLHSGEQAAMAYFEALSTNRFGRNEADQQILPTLSLGSS
jgi:hypothetical protein